MLVVGGCCGVVKNLIRDKKNATPSVNIKWAKDYPDTWNHTGLESMVLNKH